MPFCDHKLNNSQLINPFKTSLDFLTLIGEAQVDTKVPGYNVPVRHRISDVMCYWDSAGARQALRLTSRVS